MPNHGIRFQLRGSEKPPFLGNILDTICCQLGNYMVQQLCSKHLCSSPNHFQPDTFFFVSMSFMVCIAAFASFSSQNDGCHLETDAVFTNTNWFPNVTEIMELGSWVASGNDSTFSMWIFPSGVLRNYPRKHVRIRLDIWIILNLFCVFSILHKRLCCNVAKSGRSQPNFLSYCFNFLTLKWTMTPGGQQCNDDPAPWQQSHWQNCVPKSTILNGKKIPEINFRTTPPVTEYQTGYIFSEGATDKANLHEIYCNKAPQISPS